ncbi:Rec8 like protein-domain-containing protein [Catenaria anguillulae PL171]|uniref:Rec8 like protein-domain-containing protein n=1 Tax=Catenaria anguillulae PL171 TaxID=765915 RepID=A0A1Y2H9H8_9FUNG|nr:Rec8 like protein-domain-containing protein [Catenaria anguillulae PL171]
MCMQPEHGSGLQPRHGSGPSEDLGMTTVADKYEYQADSSYKKGMCPLTQLDLGTLCSLHEARTTRLVPSPLRLTPAVIMLHATTTHGQGHGHGHRLLTRGANGSLSLVWIAATLGPKAHLKRISKREIVSLNVPAACRLIAEPTLDRETMPLRISSTLLSGVSRVYGQQYNLHFNNVINVIDQIRLHMSSKRPTDITLDQPKVSDENRVETITLPLYPDIDLFGPAITLDMPTFLPPLTPIAPAAFPEEFLPAPGGAPLGFRAGTPSMELGRGYEPTGIGMASDLTTSDFGGYAGGYVFPESARAGADQESPSFVSSTTRTSISTRRVSGLRAAAGAGAGPIPTISELAMAEEREHGIMDLDLGLDLPPIPAQVAGQEDIGGPLGFERMSPLLQALPSLSPNQPHVRHVPCLASP